MAARGRGLGAAAAIAVAGRLARHDCVEGWSCIGKWTDTRLSALLNLVQVKPDAKYLAFYCADTLELTLDGTGQYYESIDLIDAMHPQTILAYDMNDRPLPVPHGAADAFQFTPAPD